MQHFLLFCFLTGAYVAVSEKKQAAETVSENSLFCSTDVCNERANLINESLNNSVEPCMDFYTFACGGWERHQTEKHGDVTFGMYDVLAERVQKAFRDMFDKIIPRTNAQNITDKVGLVYNACMAFPNVTVSPKDIEKVLGWYNLSGWPMFQDPKNVTTAMNATDMLLTIGMRAVFDLSVERDPRNATSHILQLRYPQGKAVDEENYKGAIKAVVRFLRKSANETQLTEFSDRVATYGKQLKNLKERMRNRKDRAAEVTRVTIGELQNNFSNIPILKLLNQEFAKVNISLTENDTIELHTSIFYRNLSDFLQTADPINVFNYAGVRMMYTLGEHISQTIRQKFLEVKSSPWKERWQMCTHLMRSAMPEILDYLFVQHSHNGSLKTEVEDTARRIKEAFYETFLKNGWVKNETRKLLLEKVNKTTVSIGYPMELMNQTFIAELSEDIPSININGVFIEILHNISESHYRKQLKMLREPWDPEKLWTGRATAVKTLYSALDDRVEIPWALVQPPGYGPGLPRSLTFGAIGSHIGHAFARAFSIQGPSKSVDGGHESPLGNLTEPQFEKIKECFISQYGNISVRIEKFYTNKRIDGLQTLRENIIDNVGLRATFNAYSKFLQEECADTDTRLTILKNFSGKQLFFITMGMQSCKLVEEMDLFRQLSFGTQSPPPYRVNVPLENLEAFTTVFKCDKGTAMTRNPNERCQLW